MISADNGLSAELGWMRDGQSIVNQSVNFEGEGMVDPGDIVPDPVDHAPVDSDLDPVDSTPFGCGAETLHGANLS